MELQSAKLFKSDCRERQSAIVEMGMRHLASSANRKTNEEDIKSGRSLINIKNNSGPSILP